MCPRPNPCWMQKYKDDTKMLFERGGIERDDAILSNGEVIGGISHQGKPRLSLRSQLNLDALPTGEKCRSCATHHFVMGGVNWD